MSDSKAPEAAPPPAYDDIVDAARRLAGVAVATSLIESPALNARVGGRILIKAETLQRTGSFKFRGAYNLISRLSPEARRAGIVAYSSGNHAQGVAAAAAIEGIDAIIVMPSDAPAIKQANTRGHGAQIVLYDRFRDAREAIAAAIAQERGATIVPPFDHPLIIAGQGTVGLELAAEARARGVRLDAVLAPCGGGGLAAGIATALERERPETAVFAVEPLGCDDTARSLIAGRRLANDPAARTICDALMAPMPGALTFAINRRLLAGGLAVTDDAVRAAMAYAFATLKLVVEPGGAVALAALLAGSYDAAGKTVALVLSGGNVDRDAFSEAVKAAETA